jgi:CRP/FNR family transcriptional regulator, cyclic AMP receptor protein
MVNNHLSINDSLGFHGMTRVHVTECEYKEKEVIFSQGDAADALFSVRGGGVKLMVKAGNSKRAVLRVMGEREVFGEECLGHRRFRTATAVALEPSILAQVPRRHVILAIRQDPAFASEFVTHLLTRVERTEEELVDQILHSSEIRLARTLLEMSGVKRGSTQARAIHAIDQKTLAEMVGTTRSRVSFFMNRFRRLGLIDYNGSLHVYPTLLEFLNRH